MIFKIPFSTKTLSFKRLECHLIICIYLHYMGFPGSSAGKESACNAGNPGFDSWLRKIPWRRAWQSAPVFSSGESPWTEETCGLYFMGSQKVGHD